MRRAAILFCLAGLTACSGPTTAPPARPSTGPVETEAQPATMVAETALPTEVPATLTAPAVAAFPDPAAFAWQPVASGLERPVDLQADGTGRLLIVEKPGRIQLLENGQLMPTPFLDIQDRVNDGSNEMGLLGLALHPRYAENGYFYVNYTGDGGDTFISRFQASGNFASPTTESVLLRVTQPFSNHNGGTLQFGPDGYLYAGLGDGGSAGDPFGNAQNLKSLLGKILRIDVDAGDGQSYLIPADNPFGTEVLHYGLRNPWRISFDRATGDLYIGDVGQGAWEEIDVIPAGSPGGMNFGWDYYEGNHDYQPQGVPGDYVAPVVEYSHGNLNCSVTGGYVYRGALPEWNGIYLYADYCSGLIWGLLQSNGEWRNEQLYSTGERITSFGQDRAGELYYLTDPGDVYKLVRK